VFVLLCIVRSQVHCLLPAVIFAFVHCFLLSVLFSSPVPYRCLSLHECAEGGPGAGSTRRHGRDAASCQEPSHHCTPLSVSPVCCSLLGGAFLLPKPPPERQTAQEAWEEQWFLRDNTGGMERDVAPERQCRGHRKQMWPGPPLLSSSLCQSLFFRNNAGGLGRKFGKRPLLPLFAQAKLILATTARGAFH